MNNFSVNLKRSICYSLRLFLNFVLFSGLNYEPGNKILFVCLRKCKITNLKKILILIKSWNPGHYLLMMFKGNFFFFSLIPSCCVIKKKFSNCYMSQISCLIVYKVNWMLTEIIKFHHLIFKGWLIITVQNIVYLFA